MRSNILRWLGYSERMKDAIWEKKCIFVIVQLGEIGLSELERYSSRIYEQKRHLQKKRATTTRRGNIWIGRGEGSSAMSIPLRELLEKEMSKTKGR